MIQNVKRKRPLLLNGFLLHHDNARPHFVRCVLNVSQQKNVVILPHPLYSPDRTPCDFWWFPQLKKPLRDKRFAGNKAFTTSGCFYRGRIIGKLEEGRTVTSVAAEFELLTASFHDFGDNFKLQEQLSGGSVVVVHEEPHPQMTGTLSYRSEETGGRQREKSLDTRHRRLDDRYRVFTVARRLHGGGLFARRPVRCVPLTPAHRRRRSLGCREHRNWRDKERGRVLFTDESRFSLSSDSHRILIWRERGSRNHLSNIIVGEASCLVVVQTFTSSTQVQSTGPVIVTRFFFHMCVFLEALWVCSSFSWTTMHHVIAQ
ncbi:transposable element Tc1 transposase [Trichonephila clavipes]|nr:transposable element Tc1 transposase [Trichonephila clavipes]